MTELVISIVSIATVIAAMALYLYWAAKHDDGGDVNDVDEKDDKR